MRRVPETYAAQDWPRKVAAAVNASAQGLADVQRATDWAALQDFADDTAAAAGGVAVGSLYRTGSAVKVRVT